MLDLHFELVTPERLVRSDDVHMVVVPGVEGEFGVMAGHAPVMTTLKDGDLKIVSAE
jgi:F-type H+-transporting ATPase subunit epsilon